MIKAKNIRKHYDNLEVLKGVDIEIKKGEISKISSLKKKLANNENRVGRNHKK